MTPAQHQFTYLWATLRRLMPAKHHHADLGQATQLARAKAARQFLREAFPSERRVSALACAALFDWADTSAVSVDDATRRLCWSVKARKNEGCRTLEYRHLVPVLEVVHKYVPITSKSSQ